MKKFNFSKGLIIGLLTLALCFTAFGAVKASAAGAPAAVSASYDPATDKITPNGACQVFVLKAAKDNTLKKGATGIAIDGATSLSDLGIKATTKDVYLYVCAATDIEDEKGVKVNANLTIKAQAAKKIVGVINYTKADVPADTNVLSAVVTDADKKEIKNPVIYWWDGDAEHDWAVSTTFTGEKLASMLEAGGTIYIKQLGTANQFSSKAVKVKIAKQAKAPKVKLNVKNDTLALKNGFDFGIAAPKNGSEDEYEYTGWHTILPVLKDATYKKADESIVLTSAYTPLNKKDKNAKTSYTQYKFKSIAVKDVFTLLNKTEKFNLAVRKSATEKKPASAVSVIELDVPAPAPLVYTKDKVDGEYLVGSVAKADFEKKGIVIGEIKNYPGTLTEGAALAVKGFWNTFDVVTEGVKEGTADEATAAYEYCVVKQADYVATGDKAIDWTTVSWKKIVPGKTKITSKFKTKYSLVGGGKAIEAKLTAVAEPAEFVAGDAVPAGVNMILIRRAGTKAGVRASDAVKLYVVSDTKNVYLYSTVDLGRNAAKYTIQFASYKYTANVADKTGWFVDDSIAKIEGYFIEDAEVEVPALDGADYFVGTPGENGAKLTFANNASAVTLADGKYTVDFESISKNVTVTLAIKKFVNAKVEAVWGKVNNDTFSAIKDLDPVVLANISDGQIGGTGTKYYIGDAFTLTNLKQGFAGVTTPGYVADEAATAYPKVKVAATEHTPDTWNKTSTDLTTTIVKDAEITIQIQYALAKTYTVTIDPQGGSINGDKVFTTDYKTLLPTSAANVINGGLVTAPTGKKFKELNTKADGTGSKVTNATTFSADTTIYVIYQDAT